MQVQEELKRKTDEVQQLQAQLQAQKQAAQAAELRKRVAQAALAVRLLAPQAASLHHKPATGEGSQPPMRARSSQSQDHVQPVAATAVVHSSNAGTMLQLLCDLALGSDQGGSAASGATAPAYGQMATADNCFQHSAGHRVSSNGSASNGNRSSTGKVRLGDARKRPSKYVAR